MEGIKHSIPITISTAVNVETLDGAIIDKPTDLNYGTAQFDPLHPLADNDVLIPGNNKDTTAPDAIDYIISYLETLYGVSPPLEDLTGTTSDPLLRVVGSYKMALTSTGALVDVVPYSTTMPDSTLVTPINVNIMGGDIITAIINGSANGVYTINNYSNKIGRAHV